MTTRVDLGGGENDALNRSLPEHSQPAGVIDAIDRILVRGILIAAQDEQQQEQREQSTNQKEVD